MSRVAARVTCTKYKRLQISAGSETRCDRWRASCNYFNGDSRVEVWTW